MPWNSMHYFYCVVLGKPEAEFWKLTLRKYCAIKEKYDFEHTPPEEREVPADYI